ncbi:hypothetical protein CSCA_5235 [Clostridium scatologenes]|uniref:Uncharacterized protein n=1 Tax=Clostridium scatologenes TaxID=1548 RepID=A0A0E3JSH1_CLOSL|nr:hypothetical protein CSCA_5235 [Clostridium scatologenes]
MAVARAVTVIPANSWPLCTSYYRSSCYEKGSSLCKSFNG